MRVPGLFLAPLCRVLAVALLSGTPGATSALAAQPRGDDAVTAVFLNPGKRGEIFWDMVTASMQAAARQLDVDLEIVHAERDYRQMRMLGHAIVRRVRPPQYLIVTNEDDAAAGLLETADAAGVRGLLISSDITIPERERLEGARQRLRNWIATLVPDVAGASLRMTRAMIAAAREKKLLARDGKLHILALAGKEGTPASSERLQGLHMTVESEPDVVVDRVLNANWNAADAEALTRKYLSWAWRSDLRPAGIWAGSDAMALGALKALRAEGLTPGRDVMVVGRNWTREAVEEVRTGGMVLADGGHFRLGMWSIIVLRDTHDGCNTLQPGQTMTLPTVTVTRDNAAHILPLLDQGLYLRADVNALRGKVGSSCRPYDFSMDAYSAALQAPGVE